MIIKCVLCGKVTDKSPFGGKFETKVMEGVCQACIDKLFPKKERK